MKSVSGKAQALSGLLLYRASSGSIDNEYFASILQQMYRDKIKNIHIDPGALSNSLAEVDLDKLVLIPLKTATCALPKEPRVRGKSATPLRAGGGVASG
jgi:hypothetical protein